jgi:VCBS repeat-containing protein
MCANAFASSVTRTFTTRSSTDTTAPTIDLVFVESLPNDLDGSGTYVDASGTGGNAFDVFLPLNGFLLDVRFSDADSGVDESQFTATSSSGFGIYPPTSNLASNFTVTGTGATWRLPSTSTLTAGENVTFTFTVKDRAGVSSSSKVITLDVVGKDTTCVGKASTGHAGGDHDPFDARKTWVIRADLDAYTVVYSGTGASSGAVTTATPDNVSDLEQSLRYAGLGTGSMTSAAAATANGTAAGTNAIVRNLFLKRYRELLRARYGIAEDGTRVLGRRQPEFAERVLGDLRRRHVRRRGQRHRHLACARAGVDRRAQPVPGGGPQLRRELARRRVPPRHVQVEHREPDRHHLAVEDPEPVHGRVRGRRAGRRGKR